jgi:valyl-tRNA synthetase
MIAPCPVGDERLLDTEAEQVMDAVIEVVRSIRNARAEHKVAVSKWIEASVYADSLSAALSSQSKAIATLAKVRPLNVLNRSQRQAEGEKALVMVLKEAEVVLPWVGMVDVAAERKRLEKEVGVTQAEVARLEQRLQDDTFIARAPVAVVEKDRDRLQTCKGKLARLNQELAQLG